MKNRDILAVFNRGRISRLALARTDVSRVALSAETQTNWMPRTLGSMMLRPGLGYIGTIPAAASYIPFVYETDDKALIELSALKLRVWDDGNALVTRPAVTAAVTNDFFNANLTGWTDADEAGAASAWAAGGYMELTGTGYASAIRRQQVTVNEAGIVHALRVEITRGPVLFRVGTAAGLDDIFTQAVLRTGWHSLAFTPSANFWVEFSSSVPYPTLVTQCAIEAAGIMELVTPWTSITECRKVRWAQSADVVFCACKGFRQRRIERRANNSWSVVNYETNDGPFLTENTENIRLTPSAITGSITLTSSRALFRSGHVGAIFRMESQGQIVTSSLTAQDTYSNPIKVTGVDAGRIFEVTRSGTWSGTLSLQRSLGEVGAWVTVATYTTNAVVNYDDALDNSIAWYRIGFETGNYTSGTAVVTLTYAVGSIAGVVRLTAVASSTSASAVVLEALGGTAATEVWAEGAWSSVQGWPSAGCLWEGRLWWAGQGRLHGSVSDAFDIFDPETEGDSGPINRAVGEGAVATVNWMLPLQRMISGADGAEYTARSNSFDEPITPTNFNSKSPSSKGSASVPAAMADGLGYFVGRTGVSLFELRYESQSFEFSATDMTLLVPEIGDGGFIRVAVQQSPDMRVHCVRADGTVAVLVRDAAEDVMAWVDVETDGEVQDVAVLPGDIEDEVYYLVQRTIDGNTVRYHEKWALESEARGGDVTKCADSFVTGTGPDTVLAGLDHLEGEEVVVWADGVDQGAYTVSGGEITVDTSVTNWCAGLTYQARYKSAKLAGQTSLGLSLTQRNRINKIGLILADTHAQGITFGPDFTTMDGLPLMEDGVAVDGDAVWEDYDRDMIEFPGDWSTDSRVCLEANAPRPCTVLAAVMNVDRQDAQ